MARRPRLSSNRLRRLFSLVRESHATPISGQQHKPLIPEPEELGVTFIGHSSFLVQIAGKCVLIDPVFATRLVLLRRQRRPGVRISDLPPIDLVLLTHAHMDHLNLPSLRAVIRHTRRLTGHSPAVVVPWGVQSIVRRLGFSTVIALEWWQSSHVAGLEITLTPSRHWGARMLNDTHRGFGGYNIAANGHSLYHSGDTGYFSGFREIGRRLRPQVALLPIGAYSPDSFRAVHTSPEDALQAFLDLGTAQYLIPMHFGTFKLSREPMDEPPVRLTSAAARAGVANRVRILTEGETAIFPASAPGQALPARHAHPDVAFFAGRTT